MATLPITTTAAAWAALKWERGQLDRTNSRLMPLGVMRSPRTPGIYRMTWTGTADWAKLDKHLLVKASKRIADRRLDFSDRTPPVLLTIGRSTNIHKRIRQHFGSNLHNNRMLSRLGQLLPAMTQEQIIELARVNLSIAWVVVADWIERCLLEKYGVGLDRPLLDLEAEH